VRAEFPGRRQTAEDEPAREPRGRRILLVAGEASGDRHAAGLVREAHKLDASLAFEGVGGSALERAGTRLLHEAKNISVVGIVEVFERLPAIWRVYRDMKRRLREDPPAALLLVDFPDFNLRLAAAAARIGVPVVYFISPQVWAWRSGRVNTIRRLVDKMIVLFPFEEEFYRRHGVPVVCAGHPLAEVRGRSETVESARRRLGLDPAGPVFGLLPGSRDGEVRRHFPPLVETARRVAEEVAGAAFVVPVADTVEPRLVNEPLEDLELPVLPVHNDFETAVSACDAAVVASGTATLELAALDVPHVVVYRVSRMTHLVGALAVRVGQVSLVNLIAGRTVVPELLQSHFTPERAAAELIKVGRPGSDRDRMLEGLAEMRSRLGPPGAYGRAARALIEALDAAPGQRRESAP